MRSVHEAASGLRRDRIRQLGVVLVGTSGSMLRSLSQRFGDYRQPEGEGEESAFQSRPVQFNPRPVPPGPSPREDDEDDENVSEVTELNATEERKRRAAE
jgi:hypothetical protein